MATEINQAKLDKLVKSGKTQAQCAHELGISPGQLGMLNYGQALVRTGKLAKAPATAASVKKLRDKDGLRWEFIAAATGMSVAKVRDAYGDKESYIGRGRKPGNGSAPAKKTGGTAASKKGPAKKSGTPARARTRAERQAKAGNPS